MSNIMFGWQRLYEGTPSGGSWLEEAPSSFLLTPDISDTARTTDATEASSQVIFDYGDAVTLRLFALIGSNIQKDGQWKIVCSNNADLSAPVWDSGFMDAWPYQWPTGLLPSGHINVSSRKFDNNQILRRHFDVVCVAPEDKTGRYWGYFIKDTTNTNGYIEIGFRVATPVYQPSGNMDYGADWGRDTTAVAGTSDNGRRVVPRKRQRRVLAVSFDLRYNEVIMVLQDMLDDLQLDQPVYIVFDPEDTYMLQRRSFFAQQKQLSNMKYASFDKGTLPIVFEEVI